MQFKILARKILLITIFLMLVFLNFVGNDVLKNPKKYDLSRLIFGAQASSLPVRIRIPDINVDAGFQYVGLTKSGAMDVSKSPDDVSWYNLGPRPGEKGNAVIAGHSGWKDDKPAVFDNLYKLKKGDRLYVLDDKGITFVFVVEKSLSYDSEAITTDIFISNDDMAHLNLITCEGVWNEVTKSHPLRLVVFADRMY